MLNAGCEEGMMREEYEDIIGQHLGSSFTEFPSQKAGESDYTAKMYKGTNINK
jgi:hypothetical protein